MLKKKKKKQRRLHQLVEQGWQTFNRSNNAIPGDFAFSPLDGGRTVKAH